MPHDCEAERMRPIVEAAWLVAITHRGGTAYDHCRRVEALSDAFDTYGNAKPKQPEAAKAGAEATAVMEAAVDAYLADGLSAALAAEKQAREKAEAERDEALATVGRYADQIDGLRRQLAKLREQPAEVPDFVEQWRSVPRGMQAHTVAQIEMGHYRRIAGDCLEWLATAPAAQIAAATAGDAEVLREALEIEPDIWLDKHREAWFRATISGPASAPAVVIGADVVAAVEAWQREPSSFRESVLRQVREHVDSGIPRSVLDAATHATILPAESLVELLRLLESDYARLRPAVARAYRKLPDGIKELAK